MQRQRNFFALALLLCGTAAAQDYPIKPIRWVIPFPPGGGADATARTVTQRMVESLGRPIIVDARPGAGGNIGTELVARAAADGYTVLQTTNGHTIQPHLRKLPWDPLADFAPVSLLCTYPLVVAVHPAVAANDVRQLVSHAKANPGKLTYGSSGAGGPLHIGAELFKRAAGIDVVHVPYKGNAPMTLTVVAGEVNMVFDSLTGPLPHIRAGRLRALAVTGARRATVLPEVQTTLEAGIGVSYEAWNGVVAPARTPRAAIARLNREIAAAVANGEVRERLIALGYDPVTNSPEAFAMLLAADLKRFGELIRAAGIRADN